MNATGTQHLGSVWTRGITHFRARAADLELVDQLSDAAFDELLNPGPLAPVSDRDLLALDDRRIAAEAA